MHRTRQLHSPLKRGLVPQCARSSREPIVLIKLTIYGEKPFLCAFTVCIYARSFQFPPLSALDKKVITTPFALCAPRAACFLLPAWEQCATVSCRSIRARLRHGDERDHPGIVCCSSWLVYSIRRRSLRNESSAR